MKRILCLLIMPIILVAFTGIAGAAEPMHYQQVAMSKKPSAMKNPCAANPCAANPCAANPCAAKNPCAANPCAGKNPCMMKNPCAPGTYAIRAARQTRLCGTRHSRATGRR